MYRIKFESKVDQSNKGYFQTKLNEGFMSCSLLHPHMASVMSQKELDDVMQFLKDQGEYDYYDFVIEEV